MSRIADSGVGASELVVRIDGRHPMSAGPVAAIRAVCDRAEQCGGEVRVIVYVSGSPQGPLAPDLTVGLVSKWERALRRLERLPVATTAVASGDCGGLALDALLATDYRIADPSVRLVMPVQDGTTWPGMGLYRLTHQAGVGAIRRAMLFGIPIDAGQALALHLIDELTDDTAGGLAAAARLTWAVSGAELAIRRQLIFDASTTSFEEALGVHLAACDRMLRRVSAGAAP
jgi:isomerase DpgB